MEQLEKPAKLSAVSLSVAYILNSTYFDFLSVSAFYALFSIFHSLLAIFCLYYSLRLFKRSIGNSLLCLLLGLIALQASFFEFMCITDSGYHTVKAYLWYNVLNWAWVFRAVEIMCLLTGWKYVRDIILSSVVKFNISFGVRNSKSLHDNKGYN